VDIFYPEDRKAILANKSTKLNGMKELK